MERYLKLQNGSDVRGVALEGVAGEPVTFTEETACTIGAAFARWLSAKKRIPVNELRVSVGTDSRLSAELIKRGVAAGLSHQGVSVFDSGLSSTPAMYMSTVFEKYAFDGAIMLTASHLPFNRNGMKFFIREGGLEKQDIQAILQIAGELGVLEVGAVVAVEPIDLMDDYAAHLVAIIREGTGEEKPLEGLRIVVDAGNGAGGFFVDRVLMPLGADTTGSQFLEPDGSFPNHIPNPEDRDAMAAIIAAVKANGADFGIIFDTDVDRAGAVDKQGMPINRNRFIALMAAIVLEEHPGSTIVTDSVTSIGLKWWIEEKLGGVHHRYKRGYKNVINEAIRLNNQGTASWLALETSGHGALKENYFLDDGAYQVAKILIKMAKLKTAGAQTIDEIIAELPEPVEAQEFRVQIDAVDFAAYAEQVLSAFLDFVEATEGWSCTPNSYEGVHVTCAAGAGCGWALLRKSLHDPQMPLNIESDEVGGVALIAQRMYSFLSGFEGLTLPGEMSVMLPDAV
jgi:phosphomannomutase